MTTTSSSDGELKLVDWRAVSKIINKDSPVVQQASTADAGNLGSGTDRTLQAEAGSGDGGDPAL